MKIYKMLVWKYTGIFGIKEAEKAYKWLMQASLFKRPFRLWCIKHRYSTPEESVFEWIKN